MNAKNESIFDQAVLKNWAGWNIFGNDSKFPARFSEAVALDAIFDHVDERVFVHRGVVGTQELVLDVRFGEDALPSARANVFQRYQLVVDPVEQTLRQQVHDAKHFQVSPRKYNHALRAFTERFLRASWYSRYTFNFTPP